MDAMANTAARPASLCDQLLDQWHLVDMEDNMRVAGEFLIGFIDDDGYLRTERATILSQMPPEVNADDLDPALELIKQSIEPVGIGAANLCECLMLQIDFKIRMFDAEYDEEEILENLLKIRTLVANHLKDIEVNRLPKIAKAMDCDIDEVKTLIAMLRQFRPHPGRMLVEDSPRLIRPDAVVEFDEIEDHYVARLTSDRFPTLQISPSYEKMASDKSVERKTREFVSNNMISANWLITAIDQRHSTLLRVISVVLDAQRDFFDQGPQHLKPLPMTSVADQLGIHVATVSRAVSEKYIQSPRGIFPLRMFFSGGTETESGDSMSWAAVQAKLEQIIEEEDKSKPYNDDQLVEKLKEKGIEIARRTVAKYRKQLNIPPARQRKEF
jgi:RNA polymerase sigma-54 factor